MEIYVLSLSHGKYFIGVHYIPDREKFPGRDHYLPNTLITDIYPPSHICEITNFDIQTLEDLVITYTNRYGANNVYINIDQL